MTASKPDAQFERVVDRIAPQSTLLRTWELKGGVSAQVTALEIEQPDGQTKRMVVRRHGARDFQQNPRIAADEFMLLHNLRSAGLATPAPYYLDQSGEIFHTPYIVVEYIEGKPEFAPADVADFIEQLAIHLSRIHRVDCSTLDWSFLPPQEHVLRTELGERPARVNESWNEGRIRDTLESIGPLPQRNQSTLLHGDFWPGNTLWRDGRLIAIIDWEDAALGDPLADVGNTRLEILWAFGVDAMNAFTHRYKAMTALDFTNLPYWDLAAALRPASRIAGWGVDDVTEQTMRERHTLFITHAFAKLGSQPRK